MMDEKELLIETVEQAPVALLRLSGILDIFGAPEIRQAMELLPDGELRFLILDLEAISFIDSAGLGALVNLQARLRTRNNIPLALIGVSPRILQILRVTRLSDLLKIYDTKEQALAAYPEILDWIPD